jgi:hypothetical protein
MVAGDIIDPSIAEELRSSACMIVLFTGKYFSKAKSYCAREYLAMTRPEPPGDPIHPRVIRSLV